MYFQNSAVGLYARGCQITDLSGSHGICPWTEPAVKGIEMKILVICQHYWPEPFVLPDICEELVNRGHQVHVVTDVPNYPDGIIYQDYRRRKNREQVRNGVRITRTFTIGRRKNALFRLLNYFSYPLSSMRFVRKLTEEYDVVLAYQFSPVIMASAALKYARRNKKKVLLYSMDLWPASLGVGGIREGSVVYRVFHWLSKKVYSGADKLVISSEGFREYMSAEFDIEPSRVEYLPQYADNAFTVDVCPETEELNLVFAGNIGVAQSVQTIIRAAARLKDHGHIHWHIVGNGSALEECKALASRLELQNVHFHGYLRGEQLQYYYAKADAMLMTLIPDPAISLTLPLKVMSYMASGKPIIAAVGGAAAKEIRQAQCGYAVPPEDDEALAEAVLSFEKDPEKSRMGSNAYAYYREHFTKEHFIDRLEKLL